MGGLGGVVGGGVARRVGGVWGEGVGLRLGCGIDPGLFHRRSGIGGDATLGLRTGRGLRRCESHSYLWIYLG